jgi:hypothetical protein
MSFRRKNEKMKEKERKNKKKWKDEGKIELKKVKGVQKERI